jgi:23S rRNA pseudouridine1911/1915/1917 synthase
MNQRYEFRIAREDAGRRLDEFLASRFGSLSRMRIANLIAAGSCLINDIAHVAGHRIADGDLIEISFDEGAPGAMIPEPIPLEILYEDEHLVVVVKPAGRLVHPTRSVKSGTLANALVYHLNRRFYESLGFKVPGSEFSVSDSEFEVLDSELKPRISELGTRNAEPQTRNTEPPILNPEPILAAHGEAHSLVRPGIVHRLDRATSGLMVVAKSERALSRLSSHFHRRLIEKRYHALVHGKIREDQGAITAPIGRDPNRRPRWWVMESGKAAETRFRVVERFDRATLVELEPVTGRTNQLRIHCCYYGHPIIGDELYENCELRISNCGLNKEGSEKTQSEAQQFAIRNSQSAIPIRLCLHAYRLAFHHPATGDWKEFTSPLPADFISRLNVIRSDG